MLAEAKPVAGGLKILVVRRDNIGDLVCATPLFAALRARHPQAHIAVLVNSYNAGVLAGNPDVDAVHVYTKLKHRPDGGAMHLAAGLEAVLQAWHRLAR